jgi:hypothetical protein
MTTTTLTIAQKRAIISGLKGIVGLGDAAHVGYKAADPEGWDEYYAEANAWAGNRWNTVATASQERAIIRELEEDVASDAVWHQANAEKAHRIERLRLALAQVWAGFCGELGELGPPKRGGDGGWALEHLQPGDMPDWDAAQEGRTK